MLKNLILSVIDFFYPPFRRYISPQNFRYLACGGGNVLLDLCIFYVSFHFILHEQPLDLGFIVFKPYSAALGMAFMITFPTGFLLSKYIVFDSSELRGRIQLIRYMLVVAICLLLNYTFLKVLVEYMDFYPTIARIFATCIIVTFSYLSQKHFTFKVPKQDTSNP